MWNVNNMNEILFAGDKLYKYAKKNSKTYDYLEPCDLPSYFSLDNQHYHWKVKKNPIISSVEYPVLDLETALAMTFSFNHMQSSLDVHLIESIKKVFFSGSAMPRCLIYSIELHLMV